MEDVCLLEAIAFKEGYVRNELLILGPGEEVTPKRVEIKSASIVMEALDWEWGNGWIERVWDKNGIIKEKWAGYLRRNEDDKRICRRFIVKRNAVIREEKSCLRRDCPLCWKYVGSQDATFVPYLRQLRWVCDFSRWAGVKQCEPEEVYLVGRSRRDLLEGLAPGSRLPENEEEAVFGLSYSQFPTERRPEFY